MDEPLHAQLRNGEFVAGNRQSRRTTPNNSEAATSTTRLYCTTLMVSAMSAAAASAAAGPSSSSDVSPAWKQLQHRAAAPRSAAPPPSSRKLRTMPSRHSELGSDTSSCFSPPPGGADGRRSAGETRSTWRSKRRLSRDLGGAARDGSICAALISAVSTVQKRIGLGGSRSGSGSVTRGGVGLGLLWGSPQAYTYPSPAMHSSSIGAPRVFSSLSFFFDRFIFWWG